MSRRALASALALAAVLAPAAGAEPFTGSAGLIRLSPPRAAQTPVIDGRIDDTEWAGAAMLDGFTHGRPVEGVRDSLGTQCLVMYDEHNLYVAFRCPEAAGQVQAPVVCRDNIWSGDWVGVSIDSYHDRQYSYFLAANPQGVQADGIDQENVDTDTSPDFQFTSEGRVTPQGYEVEFAIPFKSLRFPPSEHVTFGFNAIRDERRTGAHMYWAPITQAVAGYHRQIGDLTDLAGIHPGRNLEVVPYVTGASLGERVNGPMRWGSADRRQGVDLKYGVTSAITASAAITPDFSQVEADAGVLDVNLRNAIYFQEKRPFFLEGLDIFHTPMSMVYTRRIVDPLYGVKVTGKSGRTALGLLDAADRSAAAPFPTLPDGVNPYLDHDAQFLVGRVRQDFSDNLSIGALGTLREHRDASNRVAALDTRWTFHHRYSVVGQHIHTWTRDEDLSGAIGLLDSTSLAQLDPRATLLHGRRYEGEATHVELHYGSKPFELYSHIEDITRDFNTLTGYFNRPGTFEVYHWAAGHFYPRTRSWFQQIQVESGLQHLYDHGEQGVTGRLTDFSMRPRVLVKLARETQFGGGINRLYTYYNGREFDPRWRGFAEARVNRFRLVRPGFYISYGDDVIYSETAPAISMDPQIWADLRFSDRFDGSVNLNATRILRRENGSRFAEAVIPRVRLGYQFSRQLSLRWITELGERWRYDASDQLTSHSRTLSQDVLFTYLMRPGTVAYLGYGAGLSAGGNDPLQATRQSLFMKASYLWQM
jgi:hypothetical protein